MKRVALFFVCLLVSASPLFAQQRPDALGPNGFDAGDYVYISAQGPLRPDGALPPNFPDQVRQSLDNVKQVVESAGLTMDHVVYVQVYLEDTSHYRELNDVFASYFPKDPPARGVLGVAHVPEAPLQITAVAVRDLTGKQPVSCPASRPPKPTPRECSLTTGCSFPPCTAETRPRELCRADPAAQVNLALDELKSVLKAAGLTLANMVFVNPYTHSDLPARTMNQHYAQRFEFGNTPARATIEVSSLPEGANIAYTGVAVRDLTQRKAVRPKNMPPSPTASPCVFAGDTLVLFGQKRIHSGAQRRSLRRLDRRPDPPDHAQPSRQSRRSGHELRSGGVHYHLPRRPERRPRIRCGLQKIFQSHASRSSHGPATPACQS